MSNNEGITQLIQVGLDVCSEGNAAGPNGYRITKPSSVNGDCRPDYESTLLSLDGDDIPCDAPISYLRWREGRWCHEVAEYAPGPGPGDFRHPYPSLEEAVQAVLEYYFGDPILMNPAELASSNRVTPEANPTIRQVVDLLRQKRE